MKTSTRRMFSGHSHAGRLPIGPRTAARRGRTKTLKYGNQMGTDNSETKSKLLAPEDQKFPLWNDHKHSILGVVPDVSQPKESRRFVAEDETSNPKNGILVRRVHGLVSVSGAGVMTKSGQRGQH
jgi:hypothetical protein